MNMKSLVLKSMFVLSTSLFVPSISMAQDSDLQKLAVKTKSQVLNCVLIKI